MTIYLACDLPNLEQTKPAAIQTAIALTPPNNPPNSPPNNRPQKEELRHILLGSPSAIRQTIYRLHSLNYSESALWTPLTPIRGRLVLTSEQGEMMSLLRRSL